MKYGFGYREKTTNNEYQIVIKKHISKEEYDKHKNSMEFCRHYNHLKNIYELVLLNGTNFLTYANIVSDYSRTKELEEGSIGIEGNRLLINYLTSLGMFIDYGEKEMKKALGKDAKNKFHSKTNELYDKHVSYRFMILMRDYAVHYGFPLHRHIQSLVGQSGLFSSKETLLKFKKWKHARTDIEKMPELINLNPYIIQMQDCIKELYDLCLFMFSGKLVDVIQYTNDLIKTVNRNHPVFISFESEEKYRKGQLNMHPVDIGIVQNALKDLQNHPRINIRDKSQDELETRLEFYYNEKLIMEGTISYFKSIMTSTEKQKNNDEDPRLYLGDRFTLSDYPHEGESQLVRVIKMSSLTNRLNGQPDIIRYYVEPYKEIQNK